MTMTNTEIVTKTKIKQIHIYKRKELDSNPVEDYLKGNIDKKLSVKTLQKRLDIPLKHVFFLIKNSHHIKRVESLEVGTCKKMINVYTYSSVEVV